MYFINVNVFHKFSLFKGPFHYVFYYGTNITVVLKLNNFITGSDIKLWVISVYVVFFLLLFHLTLK